LSGRYLIENVSASGGAQLRATILGIVAGLASVGYLRGAEILMGPFIVVLSGVAQVAVPEASRVLRRAPKQLRRFCLTLGAVQASGAVIWSLFLVIALPRGLGHMMLGDVWRPSAALLQIMTLNVVFACFLTAAATGVRATGLARRSLRAQLITSALYAVLGSGGAAMAGAAGAVGGAATANAMGAVLWWYQLRLALRDRASAAPTQGGSTKAMMVP
jgi:O-antigen/teichoic acid export membrane protein